ncbi:hypothetical protein [Achromobacter spanius]|uniref:hypothetical protein n=1 Tax=Achromobacter spanius TaxID=217203 RepID=UPI003827384B
MAKVAFGQAGPQGWLPNGPRWHFKREGNVMVPSLDSSAVDEEAKMLLRRHGGLMNRVLFGLAIALLLNSCVSLYGAIQLFSAEPRLEAHAPGGAVYRPAVYVNGVRPEVPVAVTEEMAVLRSGGK